MRILIAAVVLFFLAMTQSEAQPTKFPYTINKKDFILVSLGTASFITANYLGNKNAQNLSVEEIMLLDRQDVNPFDRNATYYWNRSADHLSNVLATVLPLAPLALTIPEIKNKKSEHVATIGLMYIETILFNEGITGITKSLVGRTRPYLYNTSFTPQERFSFQGHEAPIGNTSFFSGHTSASFAAAVFVSKVYTDIYGKGTWSKIIWGTSLTLAATTAYCRVAAGEHFPTDVIVGAIVGSAIGYTIPTLHKLNSEKLSLSVLPNHFSVGYKF